VTGASVTLAFAKPARFERVVLQEFIRLGQRVEAFTVEAEVDGTWKTIGEGTTVGYKRIVRCEPTTAARVRVSIVRARACPTLATVAVY
jgi:alpha-L-fucosidase